MRGGFAMTVRGAAAMMRPPDLEERLMARKARVFVDHAVELYLGELVRRGRSPETVRIYRWIFALFTDAHEHLMPAEITTDHCRRFLDRWNGCSPSTVAQRVSALTGFFEFLRDEDIVETSPMERIRRPRRLRAEDTDVVTVSADEVRRILAGCETWQEFLCIAVLIYLGARRNAVSQLRRRDVDLEAGTMRFREKGRKVIVKPIPYELLEVLRIAEQQHLWVSGEDYLVPNRRPTMVRRQERANKVIYETVTKVARRVGVRTHVHALRAAFAVAFDEAHPKEVIALKELMGHARLEQTMVYLRRKNKAAAMEAVRDLSWGGFVLPPQAVVPPAGFEPALPA
jgi:integrase/recombinase XerD